MWDQLFNHGGNALFSGPYRIAGSFGDLSGKEPVVQKKTKDELVFSQSVGGVSVETVIHRENLGLIHRTDVLKNNSDKPVTASVLLSRFTLEGGDYDVYLQDNYWMNESKGGFLPLLGTATAENTGLRETDNSAPILAVRNRANGRVCAFWLSAVGKWKMTVALRTGGNDIRFLVAEMGYADSDLCYTLAPGETLALPEIFLTVSRNSVDFDAWKLHAYCLKRYPRRKLPVIYDTWLWCFDELYLDALTEQAKTARDLGFEIFAIDAGWFGQGREWYSGVGDWKENQTCAFEGKMRQFSDFVHSLGMGFGVWMEPERARADSESVRNHPEYYLGDGDDRFVDFANSDAFDYIFNLTSSLIETYRLDYMKYDFNATLPYDPSHASFIRYAKGRAEFYKTLRRKFPDLYMTRCGSGGYVMSLSALDVADSFWLSDNHGPTSMVRIYKDTAKRLLPCTIEKWNVQTTAPNVHPYNEPMPHEMIVNCDDASFTSVIRVTEEYALGMLSGSPLGFSCDLTVFPEDYKNKIRTAIGKFKAEREYYAGATMKILADTDKITALQYTNGKKSVIALFTGVISQDRFTVFPALNERKSYRVADEIRTGKDIAESGICFTDLKKHGFSEIVLEER